jgi:predicted aspartyl protease
MTNFNEGHFEIDEDGRVRPIEYARQVLDEAVIGTTKNAFGTDVKKFMASRGQGAGAASSLTNARHNLEKSQDHDAQAHHEGQAAQAKTQGDRGMASLHSAASGHHAALSAIHTNLASKHLKAA